MRRTHCTARCVLPVWIYIYMLSYIDLCTKVNRVVIFRRAGWNDGTRRRQGKTFSKGRFSRIRRKRVRERLQFLPRRPENPKTMRWGNTVTLPSPSYGCCKPRPCTRSRWSNKAAAFQKQRYFRRAGRVLSRFITTTAVNVGQLYPNRSLLGKTCREEK